MVHVIQDDHMGSVECVCVRERGGVEVGACENFVRQAFFCTFRKKTDFGWSMLVREVLLSFFISLSWSSWGTRRPVHGKEGW